MGETCVSRPLFAPKMYGTMKNKQVKDNSVEESRPLRQAVSFGRLSSHSRVITYCQSANWSARALGRSARSKNQRHSPIRFGSWNVGNLCGRDLEVSEVLRKRKMDVCGLKELRWRNEGTRFLGVFVSGLETALVSEVLEFWKKEGLCEKVVDIQRKSDRVKAVVLAFGE